MSSSERVISDEVVEFPFSIRAFCHLRQEERTFKISRIEEATDASTGEVITDICAYFGLPSVKTPPLSLPSFLEAPTKMSQDEAKSQRNDRQRELSGIDSKSASLLATSRRSSGHYSLIAVTDAKELPAFALDHHVPQTLGGRLVPGNVVLLCRNCNTRKRGRHPRQSLYGGAAGTVDSRYWNNSWSCSTSTSTGIAGASIRRSTFWRLEYQNPKHRLPLKKRNSAGSGQFY